MYEPVTATATEKLQHLKAFKAVHPLYGLFHMDYLGKADPDEMIQILESLLDMPGLVARSLRVPWPSELPPGRLATEVVDPAILLAGLATQDDLYPQADQSDVLPELRKYSVPLAQKMKMLFENTIDHAGGLFVTPVWAVGDLLAHGGDFDKFSRSRDLLKQEGILFKHVLRMILLCCEFAQLTPRDLTSEAWRATLDGIARLLTTACRTVDPQSTDALLEEMAETFRRTTFLHPADNPAHQRFPESTIALIELHLASPFTRRFRRAGAAFDRSGSIPSNPFGSLKELDCESAVEELRKWLDRRPGQRTACGPTGEQCPRSSSGQGLVSFHRHRGREHRPVGFRPMASRSGRGGAADYSVSLIDCASEGHPAARMPRWPPALELQARN